MGIGRHYQRFFRKNTMPKGENNHKKEQKKPKKKK